MTRSASLLLAIFDEERKEWSFKPQIVACLQKEPYKTQIDDQTKISRS